MTAPIASGWSEFAGWDLHPLESAALSRRTPTPATLPVSTAIHAAEAVFIFATAYCGLTIIKALDAELGHFE